MTSNTRTALWISTTTVVTALLTWFFSFSGGTFVSQVLGLDPPWLHWDRALLLRWQAVGLAIAFGLVLLAVRVFSAPPALWLGALAASLLLGAPYVIGYLELESIGLKDEVTRFLERRPFISPHVALFALIGYPLVIAAGCWLGTRWRKRGRAQQRSGETSHA